MISSKRIHDILTDCMFEDASKVTDTTEFVMGEAVMRTFCFVPEKVELHEKEILEILNDLPEEFQESTGGGWSFLKAVCDKNENHWGEHINVDELLALGLASGHISYLMPRVMWQALPGGLPYFMINTKRHNVDRHTKKELNI